MTRDRAMKRAVRERAASTGEKYTQALRALSSDSDAAQAAAREFDRQVATLLDRGYPRAAGLGAAAFIAALEPLRDAATSLDASADPDAGRFGFVIVVSGALVAASSSITLVRRRGRAGVLSMLTPEELAAFAPIEQVTLPAGAAYLMSVVDSGRDSRDRTPDDGLAALLARGRSLTIEEGIALVTHFPEAVATNGGLSLAGSRLRRPPRLCAVDQQGGAEARLVLGRQPAHVAGDRSCSGRVAGIGQD